MNYFLIVFLLLATIATANAQKTLDALLQQYNTRSVPYISVEELRQQQLNSDIIILDSREEREYQVSHIKGAIRIGYDFFDASEISDLVSPSTSAVGQEQLPKDKPIVIYCSLGIRSEEIGEKFKKAGYQNVKNLYGGIFEWKNNGYPVLNELQTETDSVHTFSKAWSKWLIKGVKVYSP